MVFYRDLEANQWVVPNSGYHMKIKASDRLATFLDDGQYQTVPLPQVAQDPLKFRDSKRYVDRLKESRSKTGDRRRGDRRDRQALRPGQSPSRCRISTSWAARSASPPARRSSPASRPPPASKTAVRAVRRLGRRPHAGRHRCR